MFGEILSSIFGNVGGLIHDQNMTNAANQQAWSMQNQQYQNQKEFAQQGIRWKVADAQAAGIHPLFALGGSTAQYTPSSVQIGGGDGGGRYLQSMGQDIGRAINATRTKEERHQTAHEMILASQQVQSNDLDLALKAAQLAKLQATPNPPFPGSVGGVSGARQGAVDFKANEITSSQGDVPHAGAGPAAPSNQWRVAPGGNVYVTPEKNLQMDDTGSPGWLPWMIRNHVVPYARQTLGLPNDAEPPAHMMVPGQTGWRKTLDGSFERVFGNLDRDVQRTRHNRAPYPSPQYDRRR